MEVTNSIEFDKQLENEFSKLGFNYQEIKANGIRTLGNDKLGMFLVDYLGGPHPSVDGLGVIFTVIKPTDDQSTIIEAMQATLFNDSLYDEFTPLIEKTYLSHENGLSVKEEVIKELNALLKLKQQADKGLINVFARLGFDLNDLLNSAERVNEHEIFLSKTIENDDRIDPGTKVKFTFSVTNSLSEQMYSIEHITAVMRRSIPGSRDQVLFENDYLSKEAPLPTMDEIFDQIAKSEKHKEISKKFGNHQNILNPKSNTKRRL